MAKRTAQPVNTHNVRHHRSWFTWLECEVCHSEFRRERGFMYEERWCSRYYQKYICAACGYHSEDFVYVNQYIDYMNHGRKPKSHPMFSEKPNPPPAPPMRFVRSNA